MKKALSCLLTTLSLFSEEVPDCCINTPARAYPTECSGAFLFIDPLLWKGQIGGSSIAVSTNEGKSTVSNLNFALDWGIRVGVGYKSGCDDYEALLVWTTWQNEASRKLSSENINFPTWGASDEIAQVGKGKWFLSYNILDLENGRPFSIGSCFILSPHAGLRSAWIDQKDYNFSYSLPSGERIILQRDRSWGIGIRCGIDLQWNLTTSFSFFSNFAGALLYAYHSVKHREKGFNASNFFHIGSAIFDTQIGFRYSSCYLLNFDIGWENHWLPSQNQFMLFLNDQTPGKFVQNLGSLGITGLFLRARFDF